MPAAFNATPTRWSGRAEECPDFCQTMPGYRWPTWSPDGSRLAVLDADEDTATGWVGYLSPGASSATRVAEASSDRPVAWSGDGEELAFAVEDVDGDFYRDTRVADAGSDLHDLAATIRHFTPGVTEVGSGMVRWLAPHERAPIEEDVARLVGQGVPKSLALHVAQLDLQFSALDIVEVGAETGRSVETVAGVYFGIGGRLDLGWLSQQIATLATDNRWVGLARVALRDDLTSVARGLAKSVLVRSPEEQDVDALIAAWEAQREFELGRCRQLLAELRPAATLDVAMLSVTLRELRALI